MLLLPITLAVFGFLQRWQARHVFRTLDIHPVGEQVAEEAALVGLRQPKIKG